MALTKKGKYYYGDGADDLITELERYAKLNGYPIDEAEEMICPSCGGDVFRLFADDDANGALGVCVKCATKHYIRDSQEYLDEDLYSSVCICDNDEFNITTGVSFYEDSRDARWVYVGCYCPKCGLVGNYVDWQER